MASIKQRLSRIFRRSSSTGAYQGPVQPTVNEATFRQSGKSVPNPYQGPVPQGTSESKFRQSGQTVTGSGQPYKTTVKRGGGGSSPSYNEPTATPTSITPAVATTSYSGSEQTIRQRVQQAYQNYNNPNLPTSSALNPFFQRTRTNAQLPLSRSGTPAAMIYNAQQNQRVTRSDLSPDYKPMTLGAYYNQQITNADITATTTIKQEVNKAQERIDRKTKTYAQDLQRRINDGKISVEQAQQLYGSYAEKESAKESKKLGQNKNILQAREKQAFTENIINKQFSGVQSEREISQTKASDKLYNYFTSGTGLPLDAALIGIPAARAAKLEADVIETGILIRQGEKQTAKGLAVDTALFGAKPVPKVKQQFAVATLKETPYFKQTTTYTADVLKKRSKGVSPSIIKDLKVETEYFDVGKNKFVTKIEQPRGASVFTRRGGASSAGMYADSQFKTALTKQVPFYKSEGFLYKQGTGNKLQQFSADSFVKRVDKGKIADLYQIKSGKYTGGFNERARVYALSAQRTKATTTFSDKGTLFTLKKQVTKPTFPIIQAQAQELKAEGSAFSELSKTSPAVQTKQQSVTTRQAPVQRGVVITTRGNAFKQLEQQANRGKQVVVTRTLVQPKEVTRNRFVFAQPSITAQTQTPFTAQKLTPRFRQPAFNTFRNPRPFNDFSFRGFDGFGGEPPIIPVNFGREIESKGRNPFSNKKQNKYFPDYSAAFLGLTKRVTPKQSARANRRVYSGITPKPVLLFKKKKKRSGFDLFR